MSLDEGPIERAVVFEHAAGYRLISARRFVAALAAQFEPMLIDVDLALGTTGPTVIALARFKSSADPHELATRFSAQVATAGGVEVSISELSFLERASFLTRFQQCAFSLKATAPGELELALDLLLAEIGVTPDAGTPQPTEEQAEAERRAATRYPVEASVKVLSDPPASATVDNISMSGAFVRTEEPAPLNSPLSMEISLAGGEVVKADGKVVNVTAEGMGVQFVVDSALEATLAQNLTSLDAPRAAAGATSGWLLEGQTPVEPADWGDAANLKSSEPVVADAAAIARAVDTVRAIAGARAVAVPAAEFADEVQFVGEVEMGPEVEIRQEEEVGVSAALSPEEVAAAWAAAALEVAATAPVKARVSAEAIADAWAAASLEVETGPFIEASIDVEEPRPEAAAGVSEPPMFSPAPAPSPPPAAPALVPVPAAPAVRFGPYELLSMLGRGGMGEVHFARAVEGPRAGQFLAIKRLPSRLVKDPAAVKVLLAEAQTLALLDHPNIVKAYEASSFEGETFIVMEALDGRDLGQILRQCKQRKIFLPVDFTCFLLKIWLDALDALHNATDKDGVRLNLVHCDVSPHNLFISRSGEIKLGDFGLTRKAGNIGAELAQAQGRPSYQSPEALDGEVSVASDLWAVAVTLYELLCLELPFKGDSLTELLAAVRRAGPKPARELRPSIPTRLEAVLQNALQKKANHRYQTAADLASALTPHFDPQVGTPLAIAAVVGGLFPKTKR